MAEARPAANTGITQAAPRPSRVAWLALRLLWLLVLLLVLAGARLAYYSMDRFQEQLQELRTLQEAFKETSVLMGLVVELENGQRNFLLTQEVQALTEYRQALAQLPRQVERVHALLQGRKEFAAELEQLRLIASEERNRLQAVQEVMESAGQSAAMRMRDGERRGMDHTRAAVVNLQLKLVEVSMQEQNALHTVIERRNLAIYLMILLGAAAAFGALMLLRRHYLILREEALLRASMLESQRESRQKSSFLANMSHEIRTPMNAILGFSQLLLERVNDTVTRRYVEAITVSGRSLLALLDDILDLSKIEAGKLEIRAVPTSLRETAEGVIAVFSQPAVEKRLQLSVDVDPAVPDSVLLDAGRLRQMLLNLVSNAVKYTEHGSVVVRVRAQPNPDAPQLQDCIFEVEDTGPGIAAGELQRIFEPFVQGNAPRRSRDGGSGLGLAITRQLAERMGGTLDVESTVGVGSVFRIRLLKVAAAPQSARSMEPMAPVAAELPTGKILIVDDSDLNRELLAAVFQDQRHQLMFAGSGAEALALARLHRPDLVLMDVRMPGMDGLETLRRLRADPNLRGTRVVAVTASTLRGEQMRLRSQFDGYVPKPFTRDLLLAELQRVMRGTQPSAPLARLDEESRQRLGHLLTRDWPTLRAAPAMQDVRDFAHAVSTLGSEGNIQVLQKYGSDLIDAASAFETAKVEALLLEFPAQAKELLATSGPES